MCPNSLRERALSSQPPAFGLQPARTGGRCKACRSTCTIRQRRRAPPSSANLPSSASTAAACVVSTAASRASPSVPASSKPPARPSSTETEAVRHAVVHQRRTSRAHSPHPSSSHNTSTAYETASWPQCPTGPQTTTANPRQSPSSPHEPRLVAQNRHRHATITPRTPVLGPEPTS